MISPKRFLRSLQHAMRGLQKVAKQEHSFRLQLIGFLLIIALVIVVPLANWERIVLLLLSGAVMVLEIINSIFERLSDGLKPRLHPMVKDVKDMMAGAVLVTAMIASAIAVLIFYPYIIALF